MTLYDLFLGSVQDFPKSTAVICGDESLTYEHLNQKIDELTEQLLRWGICKGDRVGVLYPNCTYYPVLLYALIRIGAVFVPFNTRYTSAEIVQHIEDIECAAFIYHKQFQGLAQEGVDCRTKLKCTISGTCDGIEDCGRETEIKLTAGESVAVSGNDPGLIIFTGGTTGHGSGVLTTHAALVNRVVMKYRDVQRTMHEDTMLNYAPLFHTGGLSLMIQTLSAGGCFVMGDKFEPETVIEDCAKYKATQMALIPPSIIYRIASASNMSKEKLSSVRLCVMAGGPTDEEIADKVFDTFENTVLYLNYGSSENSITLGHVMDREERKKYPWRLKSVGIANMASFIKLVDENGREVHDGELGEAWGRSPCQMKEYVGKGARAVNGWVPTGDMFRKDEDGYFYFVCRKKNMIKTGGENVYAEEVENVIKTHPAVKDCVIFPLPDKCFGEVVSAAVVCKDGKSVTGEELVRYCRERLASYKKPRKIFFTASFPTTAVGKLARGELIEQLKLREPDYSI